jgi:hypothetical protein
VIANGNEVIGLSVGTSVISWIESTNSCTNTYTYSFTVVGPNSNTKELSKTITLYPNPIHQGDNLILESNQIIEGLHSVEISNVSGKTVYSNYLEISNSTSLDISHLEKGMYILRIPTLGIVKKIVLD